MADTQFFTRLKKLFQAKAIVTIDKDGKRQVYDTDEKQQTNLSSLRDRYTKIQKSFYEQSGGAQSMAYQQVRREVFRDFDAMDNDPIIASALDIYADESTLKNEYGDILTINSSNEKVQSLLTNLFYDILNVEFNLWPWVRNMCKYGDFFLGLEVAEGKGIVNVTPHSVYNTERIEMADPTNPHTVTFTVTEDPNGKNKYDSYEMAHFRLLSDTNWLPYGKAMIENGRRLWKQLSLMEDAMLIHRIMRAPEKRVFKIDIGNIKPTEVDNYMQRIINKMKKIPFLDKNSGDYNLKYNMQNLTEDFYLPVRGSDSGTEIENLSGLEYTAIEDIDYLKNKLFAALKIPRAYLGYEENVCIVPETKIPLIDGTVKTVAELIVDFENGIQNYTYSIDVDQNITPGKIEWAGMTRENAELVRVWLDNNEYIDCTPDHNFLTRDNNWIEAKDLKPDQSLMPLYLDNGGYKDNYTTVYNPKTNDYKLVHNIISEYYDIKKNKNVIHHKDFNSRNNNPDNLDGSMSFWEHREYHSNLTEKTLNSPKNIQKRISDPNWIKSAIVGGRLGGLKSGKRLGEWVQKFGPSNKGNRSGLDVNCPTCNDVFYKTNSSSKIYCSKKCNTNPKYNTKYDKISKSELNEVARQSSSFSDLENKLNIDRNTLNRIFDRHNIDKVSFIQNNMPLALKNKNFVRNYPILNHKVDRVEFLTENRDTADLRISIHHNFATNAGVIIHNSGKATLAAEDVRFARTIERIQRTVVSELSKIAIVHLYSQGITDAEMTNFELALVNPSTIYEQEKINLWSEKIRLANDMGDLNMLSKEWVYTNVFNIPENDQKVERGKIIEDLKDKFRYNSIEQDGNDPAKQPEPNDVEESLTNLKSELKDKGGRPREGNTYGKDKHPSGRDPLGDKENANAQSGRQSEHKAAKYVSGISPKRKFLNETKDMLDESNIMDDTEN